MRMTSSLNEGGTAVHVALRLVDLLLSFGIFAVCRYRLCGNARE